MDYVLHLNLLFWLKKNRVNKDGTSTIFVRISYQGKRKEFSTQIKVNAKAWDQKNQKVKRTAPNYIHSNHQLEEVKFGIHDACKKLTLLDQVITAQSIFNTYSGKNEKQNRKTLIEVIDYHNLKFNEKVGAGIYSKNTLTRFEITKKKVQAFLLIHSNSTDVFLDELSMSFILDFEHYLLTKEKIHSNTAHKYIKNVNKIVNLAVSKEWMIRNPFQGFKCSYIQPDRKYLTMEEIVLLKEFEFENPSLEKVRDVFLFSCYTGFAYSELKALSTDELSKGYDGELWLCIQRRKSKTRENLPLLPDAIELVNKYKTHDCRKNHNLLLPVISNQKYNLYLKTVTELCNINKKLTTHTARHTFATTITLTNGVPIETVSKMLGHKSIKTTQIYAKVVETKVSADMKALKTKLYPGQQNEENLKIG